MKSKILTQLNKLKPTQVMVLGFALLITVGAILLSLPIATQTREITPFLNSLFTSTSAVCVTGLSIVDTGTYWSLFGQIVILVLIQIGGLGFITTTTLFAMIVKRKIHLKERLLIQESLNQFDLGGIVKLTRHVLTITFTIEFLGALILSTEFIPMLGTTKGIWFSLFHSISSFCNAGFDLMGSVSGPFTSITYFANNLTVSATISVLIILGSIGFPTIIETIKFFIVKNVKRISIHSKIVLITTAIVTTASTILVTLSEFNNPSTIGNFSICNKIINSIFITITTQTAGFNLHDISLMNNSSIFIIIILMLIGASPVSTGGGIKTTTITTIVLYVKASILNKEDVEIYGRRLSSSIIRKSLGIFFIVISLAATGTFLLSISQPDFLLTESWFEAIAAITTAGLSIGGSPNLTTLSKFIVICLMFIGRVGSFTILLAFISKKNTNKSGYIRYPEEKILVG